MPSYAKAPAGRFRFPRLYVHPLHKLESEPAR